VRQRKRRKGWDVGWGLFFFCNIKIHSDQKGKKIVVKNIFNRLGFFGMEIKNRKIDLNY